MPNLEGLLSKIIPVTLQEEEFTVDITKMLPKGLNNQCIRASKIKVKRKHPLVDSLSFSV